MPQITNKVVLKALLFIVGLIIISILGITSGVIIASNTTVFDSFRPNTISPSDLVNKSNFTSGDAFPSLDVTNIYGQSTNIDSLLYNRRTVIGFVSEGCDPCQIFVQSMIEEGISSGNDIQLLLFTSDPEYYTETYSVKAFYISEDFINQYAINGFPTIVGVGRKGNISFVSSGYIPMINSSFISQHL